LGLQQFFLLLKETFHSFNVHRDTLSTYTAAVLTVQEAVGNPAVTAGWGPWNCMSNVNDLRGKQEIMSFFQFSRAGFENQFLAMKY
jgi:hypothetical protein